MKKTVVAVMLATLALTTGCLPKPIEFKAADPTTPAIDPEEEQLAWANNQIKAWAAEYRGVGIADVVEERCVTSWESPAEGILEITVGCGQSPLDIEWLAGDILREGTSEDLQTVVAISESTGGKVTCDRPWSNRCKSEF
ncbi:hypothetical protein [Glutamicibacter sp. NPDC087344]|uniref:hypothetical protein n=1 Tax=Glutamicibacter sp. NPDC087344 TaxID=3363994 RepID=UPI003810DF35